MSLIFHIPHSSTLIPEEYQYQFAIDDSELKSELNNMTDWFTHDLFHDASQSLGKELVFPISRLLVDPERFYNDDDEPMSKVGMGVLYSRTATGAPLKDDKFIKDEYRSELLGKYYFPHHKRLFDLVNENLSESIRVLIIDCHSFPSKPLPYEQERCYPRTDICIGTDAFHTPKNVTEELKRGFINEGLSVAINKPFKGTITPIDFYQKNPNVCSIMIEVNRAIYMNEKNITKLKSFNKVKRIIQKVIFNTAIKNNFTGKNMPQHTLYVHTDFANQVTLDSTVIDDSDTFGNLTWTEFLTEVLNEDLDYKIDEYCYLEQHGIDSSYLDEMISGDIINKYYDEIAYYTDNISPTSPTVGAFQLIRELETVTTDKDGNAEINGVELSQSTATGSRKYTYIKDESAGNWLKEAFANEGISVDIKFV
ncbi:N-formylglutamate amidohydrolase [Thalassotalea crassostreae]|uniref:N-formylglutamate amidohydrolase n=1 Tax=Thalassotalea crassostreae TaxID=1763536 RepID=UPI00083809D2|nr:N-formylglutamate amidohydrolase [Thalassotalea crassostreae]